MRLHTRCGLILTLGLLCLLLLLLLTDVSLVESAAFQTRIGRAPPRPPPPPDASASAAAAVAADDAAALSHVSDEWRLGLRVSKWCSRAGAGAV